MPNSVNKQATAYSEQNKSSPKLSQFTFLLAHGAGANKNSGWIIQLTGLLESQGINVLRFNFPYMQKTVEDGKRRPPDRMPKLLQAFQQQIELWQNSQSVGSMQRLVIGGKSMGGRVASLLAAEQDLPTNLAGVICLGFPFHPPAKPDKFRGEHLQSIGTPLLVLQGERDTFGTRDEIQLMHFSNQVKLEYLIDGDHSFKPRVKSGLTLDSNLLQASEHICNFLHSL